MMNVVAMSLPVVIISIWRNWYFFKHKSYGEILSKSFNWRQDGYGHYLLPC
uniref:Uncharacterized protein n=1 Tax=Solanum lycopersicum TaxID=4081 RepID=A0A3Q7HK57_SOLLC